MSAVTIARVRGPPMTQLERANRALRMIYAVNEQLLRAQDEAALLQKVCELVVEVGGYRMSWVGRAEDAPGKRVTPVAFAGADGDYVAAADITWADEPRGRGPTGRAIREGAPQLARFILTDPLMAPWREAAQRHGYASSCALPVRMGERMFGALMVYSERPDAFDADEVRVLTEMVNDLGFGLGAIDTRLRAVAAATSLQAAARYARSLIEASLDPLVTISADGKITDVNEATVKATGVPREAIVGTDFSDYFTDPDKARSGYREVFDKGHVVDYPLTIRHRDGGRMQVLYNASVYRDADGRVLGVFAAARDVTEQNRTLEALRLSEDNFRRLNAELEQRVVQRTAQLEIAIKDLESFAYSVSHDLRAPLRAIDSFSRIVLDDYAPRLDAEGRRLLATVRRNAQTMAQLIDDILSFSRAGRAELRCQDVDVAALVRDILAELTPAASAGRSVDVRIGELPCAHADPAALRQVFVNLIGNALKFSAPRPAAVIEIAGVATPAGTTYTVRDNGIGFDPAYAHKLFGVFQRLHGAGEFAGTGIGLAIVKRIVEKHGGRVWAEGKPDEGATFGFALPLEHGDSGMNAEGQA